MLVVRNNIKLFSMPLLNIFPYAGKSSAGKLLGTIF
jgi:hypothetical protein